MSSLPCAWSKAKNSARKLKNISVARELAPAGLRSRPKTCYLILPDIPCMPDLRGLRPRAGASSLATGELGGLKR